MKSFKEFCEELDHQNTNSNTLPLEEMAIMCSKNDGFGVILKMYSRDEHDPAHMHVFDINGRELGKVTVTENIPKTVDDLIFDKNAKKITGKIKHAIVDWANSKDNYLGIVNWKVAQHQWIVFMKKE